MNPYISFIVTARNDDYGYRFLFRMQNFVNNLSYLCEKYKLNSELIIVEWNPPKKNKKLYEELKIRKNRDFLKVRFIEVPENLHKKFKESDKFPLFEYIGKNVGIRRALGEFVLTTNPDIIFNENLIEFISKKQLDKKYFYRIVRYNLNKDIPKNFNASKVLDFCDKNWKVKLGIYFRGINPRKIKFKDFKSLIKTQIINLGRLFFMFFGKDKRYLWYHGGAPGDLILMSKNSWEKFSAFPEFSVPSCGIDGYGVILAVASGLKMKRLNLAMKIYHQPHYRPFSGKINFNYANYLKEANIMLKEKRPMVFNTPFWGLKDERLKEKIF